ncbi:MAG: hypothetical protein ROO76_09035 [Terriglobia bacterium]|nr:hypothetical protein [Terriglobia bacterium]
MDQTRCLGSPELRWQPLARLGDMRAAGGSAFTRFSKTSIFCLILSFVFGSAGVRAEDDADAIRKAILFALQCNSTVGSIEDVTILDSRKRGGGLVVVRGTYKQKIAGAGIFMFKAPEAAGGVFEGDYDSDARKLQDLFFKVSLRTGKVRPSCLQ